MTFAEAVEKATKPPRMMSAESEATDRLAHAVVALALAIFDEQQT